MNKEVADNIRKFAFLMCIAVLAGMFVYYQFMRNDRITDADDIPKTEIERLISKDLEDGYPETPIEVLELYYRYLQFIYNNRTTDDQFKSLAEQVRKLYHSELLANNPLEEHLTKMKEEVNSFSKEKKKITTCTVDAKVEKKKINEKQCALANVILLLSTSSKGYSRTNESFVLALEDEKWKILGFKQSSG